MVGGGKWLYLGNNHIESSNLIVIPSPVFDRGILDQSEGVFWGYKITESSVRHAVSNNEFSDGDIRSASYEPTNIGGEANVRRSTIPKQFFADYKRGNPVPEIAQLDYGELRHFVTTVSKKTEKLVYFLSSEQLVETIQGPEHWTDSPENEKMLSKNRQRIPDGLLPDDLKTDGDGEGTEASPEDEFTEKAVPSSSVGDSVVQGPCEVLPNKVVVDQRLRSYIESHSPNSVYLIEYSSVNAKNVIDTALENNCSIYLLLRHPNRSIRWNVSESQSDRIKNQTKVLIDDCLDKIADDHEECSLYIQYYYHPASLRARRIDDELLCMGWYTFENRNSVEKTPYKKHVHGHNNPMIAFLNQEDGYNALNEMFEKSFYALWKQGDSLAHIYDNEHWDGLRGWAEGKKQREAIVRKVSGLEADHLFSHKEWMNKISEVESDFFFQTGEETTLKK